MKKKYNNKAIQLSIDKPTSLLVKNSIEILKMAYGTGDEPLYVSTSKGKDSVVIEALCNLANVPHEKHIARVSVDNPILMQFAMKDKDLIWDVPRYEDGTQKTMWNLIPKKKMPPTRIVRWCCTELKECFGKGRKVVTGVRKAESVNRSKNQGMVTVLDASAATRRKLENATFQTTSKGGIIFNLDNDENRRALELCYRTHKTLINPIIDWEDANVWDFIHGDGIPYCSEYDNGKTRLGCIGCPINTATQSAELEQFPTIKKSYVSAFQRMIDQNDWRGSWRTGEEAMDWWINEKQIPPELNELQISLINEYGFLF